MRSTTIVAGLFRTIAVSEFVGEIPAKIDWLFGGCDEIDDGQGFDASLVNLGRKLLGEMVEIDRRRTGSGSVEDDADEDS